MFALSEGYKTNLREIHIAYLLPDPEKTIYKQVLK